MEKQQSKNLKMSLSGIDSISSYMNLIADKVAAAKTGVGGGSMSKIEVLDCLFTCDFAINKIFKTLNDLKANYETQPIHPHDVLFKKAKDLRTELILFEVKSQEHLKQMQELIKHYNDELGAELGGICDFLAGLPRKDV